MDQSGLKRGPERRKPAAMEPSKALFRRDYAMEWGISSETWGTVQARRSEVCRTGGRKKRGSGEKGNGIGVSVGRCLVSAKRRGRSLQTADETGLRADSWKILLRRENSYPARVSKVYFLKMYRAGGGLLGCLWPGLCRIGSSAWYPPRTGAGGGR